MRAGHRTQTASFILLALMGKGTALAHAVLSQLSIAAAHEVGCWQIASLPHCDPLPTSGRILDY
jgi:hypothetical protein